MSGAAAAVPGGIPRWQIARAVPAGSRRARKQSQYVADALAELEAAGFRSDRVRHWGRIIETLSRHMNWDTRCTRPTWLLLAEQAADPGKPPLHKSTVARCLEWLRGRGLLGVVSTGWTRLFRPGSLAGPDEPNQAAVYVLTTPGSASEKRAIRPPIDDKTKENATLTCLPSGEAPTRARTREARAGQEPGQERIGAGSAGAVPAAAPRPGPAAGRRENRAEGLRWAAAARTLAPKVLGRLSDRHVRALGREERTAGWTPADFVRALWEPPQGRAYGFSHEVRYPAAWARTRLSAWRDPDGTVRPSWSQARTAGAAAARAEQDAYRAAAAAERAAAAGPTASPAHGSRARAALAAASPRAAAAIAQGAAGLRARTRPGPEAGPAVTPAGNRPRSTPRAPLRPGHAPAAPPNRPAPELPAWWTDAVAAAARAAAEQEAAEQAAHEASTGASRRRGVP